MYSIVEGDGNECAVEPAKWTKWMVGDQVLKVPQLILQSELPQQDKQQD
jgi:hypothetical protein